MRRTNFSRAIRFLVDLLAHGGAVGFFISGFVATALIFGREPHAIARAAARGRSAQLLGTSEGRKQAAHMRAAWIRARSLAISNAKFRRRGEKLSKISVRNRAPSHVPHHADARNSCWRPLRVVRKLRTCERHGLGRDLARYRTQNFAAAKN